MIFNSCSAAWSVKNKFACVALTVVVCFAAFPAPAAEVVIGDFEAGSFDGWFVPSWNGGGVILSNTATGATRGTSALLVSAVTGFKWSLQLDHNSPGALDPNLIAHFVSATALKMDITYDRSQFPGPHTANQTWSNSAMAVNSAATWKQDKPSLDNHTPAPWEPGSWDYLDTGTFPNAVETWTITYDYTQNVTYSTSGGTSNWLTHKTAINAGITDWLQFIIATNSANGFDQIGYIIDNIRLVVPDPAHPGDFDSDGDVDGADFVAWQTNFPLASGATLGQGDADGDGDVDGADFVVWQTNFPFTPGPGVSVVPEPGSIVIIGLAMPALLVVARWRRRAA
jgi:hypothetical protein